MTESGGAGQYRIEMRRAVVTELAASSAPDRPAALDFDEVYEEHVEFIWRTLRRLGVTNVALADAVQEALMIVHRRLSTFDGRGPLRHWLSGICVRVARREFRTRRRRQPETLPHVVVVEADSLPDAEGSDPADAAQRRDAVRILYDLLGTLDPEKREVFVLAELEQMTGPEMADVLGLPLNTIYSRLRAARQQFERALASRRAQTRNEP
jgi:RNA polymerase sigma-70 factor (ECF subfamily)